jgi:hypothetical protein
MAGQWFRWRPPDEGQGYTIASKEGLAVTIGFVALSAAVAVVPPLLGHGSWLSIAIAMILFCACVAALLATIRKHSDWRG